MNDNNNHQNGHRKKIEFELVGDHVSIFQRGSRWYANFQKGGHQRRPSLKTTSKKEARRRAIQLEADLESGRYVAARKAPSVRALIELYRQYQKGKRRSDKTMIKYEYAYRLFIDLAERLKVKTIQGVDLSFVDAFRAERVRHESDSAAAEITVHTDLVILRQLINFALRRKLIHIDPLLELQLEKPKPKPQPCWTRDEVELILTAAHEPQRSQLTLLAETGMRVGELKWLTWEDIDLKLGVIHVRPKPDGSWKPKTGDIRAVPISPKARSVLEQLRREDRWVCTANASRKYPAGNNQISERRLLEYLKRALKRLKLPGHLHTFRHAFISHALTSGIPEAIVRQWVGHVDQNIMRRYTHIADSASRAAMQRLASGETSNLQNSNDEVQDDNARDGDSAQNQHKT